jgi:inorganic pyrophosphatase
MYKYFLILLSASSHLFANPIDEIPYKENNDTYNFFIEVPAGTNQKWEVNKSNGILEWEEKKGKKRIISFLPYPGNYGFIPQTLAGDSDALDIIDLDESQARNSIKKVKILGGLYLEDDKELDLKIIAIGEKSVFNQYDDLLQILLAKPMAIENIKNWFLNYKKPGKIVFFRYLNKQEAINYIENAHLQWESRN